ncbi:MAG: rod shape-determining protein MreC [Parvularculaceae bacterium]|nr:rod shape-determining protein MreC [Parvularculaceae bacterium]
MQSALFSKLDRSGLRHSERPPARLFVLLGLSLFLTIASIYGAQASVFEKARETLLDRFAPILNLFAAPVRIVGDQIGNVGDYFAVLEENERLREENEELRIFMQQAASNAQRLIEYEAMLNPKTVDARRYIPAEVIGSTSGPFRRALVLSAGDKDGIRQGSAVVDGDGLIGHVVTVGYHASRVLLLTDANSHIPVYIEGADTEGLLSGNADNAAVIGEFSGRPQEPMEVGMRVVTSGTGGTLPRGIPVGTISNLTKTGVQVSLFASEHGTHLVRVVDYRFPDPDEPAPSDDADETAMADQPSLEARDG